MKLKGSGKKGHLYILRKQVLKTKTSIVECIINSSPTLPIIKRSQICLKLSRIKADALYKIF